MTCNEYDQLPTTFTLELSNDIKVYVGALVFCRRSVFTLGARHSWINLRTNRRKIMLSSKCAVGYGFLSEFRISSAIALTFSGRYTDFPIDVSAHAR